MEPGVVMILAGIGVFIIGVIVLTRWFEKKRRDAWRQAADELGILFAGEQNDVISRCGGMKVFSRGHSQSFRNAIEGDAGDTRITIGDYRYITGSGKNRSTHNQTVCVLESSEMDAPHCFLRRAVALFDKIGAMLGGQDIDFAEDPAFSKAFVLQGEDEAAIRGLFDDRVRAWFVRQKGANFCFEAWGNRLVFHRGRQEKPREARRLLQEALEIMRLLAAK
ncbi:MAG: hypothetical protein ACOX1P_18025 [Thermoguttaceae bacterium]